jgi:membrane associated rhomboid family serine protease/tetratricopeptide (TPR) repeat protein
VITILLADDKIELTWEQWEQWVRNGRIPPDAQICFPPVTNDAYFLARDMEIYTSLATDNLAEWKDFYRKNNPPIMTALIVGFQIRLWWLLWTSNSFMEMRWTNLSASGIYEGGEIWRLLTMGFIHHDFAHLASNMCVLFFVGWSLERALGHLNILTLYLASVLGGSLLSVLVTPDTVSIGASGGVFGFIAAASVFGLAKTDMLPDKAKRVFGWAILPYLLFMFANGWMDAAIDNWAHFGGLLGGGLMALLLDPPFLQKTHWRRYTNTVLVASAAIGGAALYFAGPTLQPLHPFSKAIQTQGSNDVPMYRSLTWEIPAGWKPLMARHRTPFRTPNGIPVRTSPTSAFRVWGVHVVKYPSPPSDDEVGEVWLQFLEELGGEVIPEPTGQPSIEMLGDVPLKVLHFRTTKDPFLDFSVRYGVKGLYVYEELWQVPTGESGRLEVLHQRLQSTIEWKPPASHVDALRLAKRRPKHATTRAKLAQSYLEIGEPETAHKIFSELIEQQPERSEGWIGLNRIARWYPQTMGGVDAFTKRVLLSNPRLDVIAEISASYMHIGRRPYAKALLDAFWERNPGNKYLRKQRRRLGLSTELLQSVPDYLYWDPQNGKQRQPPGQPIAPPTWAEIEHRVRMDEQSIKKLDATLQPLLGSDPKEATGLLLFRITGRIPPKVELLRACEALISDIEDPLSPMPSTSLGETVSQWLNEAQTKHPKWTQTAATIVEALYFQIRPKELGVTFATGLGVGTVARHEQIKFLAEQPTETLLNQLGLSENVGSKAAPELKLLTHFQEL